MQIIHLIYKTILISFISTTLNLTICQVLSNEENEIIPSEDSNRNAGNKKEFFKKIQIPKGSSLTLAAQVSRPKILPGVFLVDDAVVLDAVIELPIWMDLDRFVEAMYHEGDPEDPSSGKSMSGFVGKERLGS